MISDDQGEHLASEIENSDLSILNQDLPTRLTGKNQRATSPDISLILAHLALAVSWTTDVKLSSDHLPITISFVDDHPNPHLTRTFVNFNRADKAELEDLVSHLPQPTLCNAGKKNSVRQSRQLPNTTSLQDL